MEEQPSSHSILAAVYTKLSIGDSMVQNLIRPILFSGWLVLALSVTTVQSLPAYAASLQGDPPPAECFTDGGHLVEPRPDIDSGWALVLNFNHAPAADVTTGCVVTRIAPQQLEFALIECQISNNVRQAPVGGGAAIFDGNLWIECPGPAQGSLTHKDFDVAARAQFSASGNYRLMEHPQAAVYAYVDVDWQVALNSRYGKSSFAHTANQTNVQGQTVALLSTVTDERGSHAVNGAPLTPDAGVAAFDLDASQRITIGAQGEVWTLHELIVDPPGRCCR
jgi:hypothetical protein